MFEKPITNNAYKALTCLYGEYLARVKHGVSLNAAKLFSEPKNIIDCFSNEDAHLLLMELKKAEYIKYYIYGEAKLTDDAIVFMENRLPRGLDDAKDIISGVLSVASFFKN